MAEIIDTTIPYYEPKDKNRFILEVPEMESCLISEIGDLSFHVSDRTSRSYFCVYDTVEPDQLAALERLKKRNKWVSKVKYLDPFGNVVGIVALHECKYEGHTLTGLHCDADLPGIIRVEFSFNGYTYYNSRSNISDSNLELSEMKLKPTRVAGCFTTDVKFTPKLLENNQDKIFVFGDNEGRFGKGGQAVIRDCKNAVGICTKESIVTYWDDTRFEHNKRCIDDDIAKIKLLLGLKLKIVFSIHGYGTGLADLPRQAPKTYQYLIEQLNTNFGTNYV